MRSVTPMRAAAGGWRPSATGATASATMHSYEHETIPGRFDETTLRARFAVQPTSALRADLTLMHVVPDNGYDAWSIDNSRVTQSDQPGRDAQRSSGAALKLAWTPRRSARCTA